jgi:4-hydroxybenzoate polyprenyltransferase
MAILKQPSVLEIFRAGMILAGGSIFFSNAAHVWDDLIDAPLDALIERTRNRPIPRKAVTPTAAFIFTTTQAICAIAFFYWFPDPRGALYALPTIAATTYYPFAKRHTNFPQVILGFCLSWGVYIGAIALGHNTFMSDSGIEVHLGLTSLFLACILWTTIYDTVYAHLDREHDVKLGIGSTAVLFGAYSKLALRISLSLMTGLMIAAGILGGLGMFYFAVAVGGSALSLGLMIALVDLNKPSSISRWFIDGFWYAGGSISVGLLLEYVYTIGVIPSVTLRK